MRFSLRLLLAVVGLFALASGIAAKHYRAQDDAARIFVVPVHVYADAKGKAVELRIGDSKARTALADMSTALIAAGSRRASGLFVPEQTAVELTWDAGLQYRSLMEVVADLSGYGLFHVPPDASDQPRDGAMHVRICRTLDDGKQQRSNFQLRAIHPDHDQLLEVLIEEPEFETDAEQAAQAVKSMLTPVQVDRSDLPFGPACHVYDPHRLWCECSLIAPLQIAFRMENRYGKMHTRVDINSMPSNAGKMALVCEEYVAYQIACDREITADRVFDFLATAFAKSKVTVREVAFETSGHLLHFQQTKAQARN